MPSSVLVSDCSSLDSSSSSEASAASPSLSTQVTLQLPGAASTSELLALRRDAVVDSLVAEIKENLKLTSGVGVVGVGSSPSVGLKAASRLSLSHPGHRRHRPSPYSVPPCSRASTAGQAAASCDNSSGDRPSQLKRWNHRRRYPSTCMSSSGRSASSAADDPFVMLQELISDGSLIKEAVRRLQLGLTPKLSPARRSFYDSDDECRTPPAYAAQELLHV